MQDNLPPLPLPELRPIPAAAYEPDTRTLPPIRPGNAPVIPMGRRLRQVIGMLAGGGFVLTLGVGALEVIAKPPLKPSTLMATFEAGVELSLMNLKMGHVPGSNPLNEADYKEKIAQAERQGQAKAELAYQQQLAVVETDKQRVLQGYATLYQRANSIAQGAVQLEGQAQQFRQQLLLQSSGVKTGVIQVTDLVCALGVSEACAAAKADRKDLIRESDELSQADIAKRVNELLAGIDDPATVAVHRDQQRPSTFGAAPQH